MNTLGIQAVKTQIDKVDANFLLEGLLQHNYLPTQKKRLEDIPPIISTKSFTAAVAIQLDSHTDQGRNGFPGYDAVEYRLTRFNGVPRLCSIPHPKAYAKLALCIQQNWNHLDHITDNSVSRVVPRQHADGRIVMMDYEDSLKHSRRALSDSFGHKYVARTDISNFYPSIYSHSIPWATVGLQTAKKNRGKKSLWYNQLDSSVRHTKRDETQGILIGPGTSNIIAETILSSIDKDLKTHFNFSRYVDDYTAYCHTYEEGQEFVLKLSQRLSEYKLNLNIGKTEIVELPQPTVEDWVAELRNKLPERRLLTRRNSTDYLNIAVLASKRAPDGSVLKYALRSLIGSIEDGNLDADLRSSIIDYGMNLSFHQPTLLPLLSDLFDDNVVPTTDHLQRIICESARLRYSDMICWGLYFSHKYNILIKDCCAKTILASQDCLPMLFLYISGNQAQKTSVVDFAKNLNGQDIYLLDQYWLLLYQLFLDQQIVNPYGQGTIFNILQGLGVNFVIT